MLGSRLRLAIQKDDLASVRELVDAGARVDETWWHDSFPLQHAARLAGTAILRALLDAGATVRLADCYGRTALHEAAEHGGPEAVSVLLRHGAPVDARPGIDQPLHRAAAKEVVELLLDAGADLEARGEFGATPLLRAAQRSNPAVVHTLLLRGADPAAADDAGGTPLHEAATAESATMLLDALGTAVATAVDLPDESGYTPLCAAVQRGLAGVAAVLLAHGADPGQRLRFGAEPLLHHAAWLGAADVVRVLLRYGADAGRTDHGGNLALHQAADAVTAGLLLTAGGPGHVRARNVVGQTPLHRAGERAHVDLLLRHGADPEATDAIGRRPMDVLTDVPGAVTALLGAGVPASAAALTAVLDRAVGERAHQLDVVALLDAGARPDDRAVRVAAQRGDDGLRAVLTAHGVQPGAWRLDPAEQHALPQRALVVHPGLAEAVTIGDEPVLVRWALDADRPRPVAAHAIGEARWEGRTVPRALAVSPDGTWLAAAGGDRLELRPWHDFTEVTSIRPGVAARLVGVAHDAERIVVSAVRSGPLVFDLDGHCLADLGGLARRFGPASFAGAWPGGAVPVGDRVVSLADDAGALTLTGTDLTGDGPELRYLHADDEVGFLRERTYCVGWLGCAPGGGAVAAWTHAQGRPAQGVLVVVDPEDGSLRWTRHLYEPGDAPCAAVCFSPDGRWLAVGLGARVHWLAVADGALGGIAALPGPACALAWDHTANGLLVATGAGLHRSPAVDHDSDA